MTDPSQLPTDPVGPAGPTNPIGPADPADPARPTNPADPADPARPTNPVGPTQESTIDPMQVPGQPIAPLAEPSDSSDQIHVAVIDDQALVRAGLAMVIDSQADMTVIFQAGDGAEAVASLGTDPRIDVVLMDVRMPNVDGLEACAQLVHAWAERGIDARIIMLTTFDIDEYALVAIQAGASGFLLKDAPPEEMLRALRNVHAGDAVLAPSTTRRLLDRLAADAPTQPEQSDQVSVEQQSRVADLTDREREVLVLVAQGLSNQEISASLFVAEATAKTHLGRILTKLGVRDRVQAVVFAYESGLVHPGQ